MNDLFETIDQIRSRVAVAEASWRKEAYALEHGRAYLLRGPNSAMPHHVARGYADDLAALLAAIDGITGPPPADFVPWREVCG